MAYTNATFYLDPVSGSDTARTALTTCVASNPSGTVARINKTAHGLVTGAVVDLTLFTAWLNAAFKITVVDADNFDLDATTWQATADNNGTVTPRGGSSKADAWKTFSSGASLARVAAGDTVRLIASLDATSLGQSATWTNASKTVTLTTAVTADIDTGESAWTASANVTCTTSSTRKEGSFSASHAIASGFTTGLAAYKAFSATDFSGYKQVSLWLQSSTGHTAGQLQLKLCSDSAGATPVDSLDLPACPVANSWMPVVIDKGSALGASIQSVALYVAADFGATTVLLDNIIACKDSASADSLTLQSLIGKPRNINWAASTAYASNDIRKPTSPNRNGFCFKVTAGGGGNSGSSEPTWPTEIGATVSDGALTWTCDSLEETWLPLQSIRGTTLLLDNSASNAANAGRGYAGSTETVAIYKREPMQLAPVASASPANPLMGLFVASGSATAPLTFSGGWDRSSMASQTGETWIAGSHTGAAYSFNNRNHITLENLSASHVGAAFNHQFASSSSSADIVLRNCHAVTGNGLQTGVSNSLQITAKGLNISNCTTSTNVSGTLYVMGRCIALNSSLSNGFSATRLGQLAFLEAKNNSGYGISGDSTGRPINVFNYVSANNSTGSVTANGDVFLTNATISEGTQNAAATPLVNQRYCYTNLNGAGSHKISTDGGTITSSTAQRHTASGISWLFNPTTTDRHTEYPLTLSVAKIAAAASATLTLGIWVRRDSTNIKGRIKVKGGQIAGIGADAYTDCQPSINTWTQYTLAVTPTEAAVFEVVFECYDGVGTTNSLWIDDFSKA